MRVVFVAALPPERSSMVGRILPLARAVRGAGHDVVLYTLSGKSEAVGVNPLEARPLEAWPLEGWSTGPNIRLTDETIPSPLATLRRWRAGLQGLRRALASERPDLIVLTKPQLQNTGPALELARRTGAPLVLDVDDLEAEASRLPTTLRWYAAHLERRAACAASLITACSPYLVEYFRRRNPHARVELLPTGLSITPTAPQANLRQRLGLAADARIILYAGSLSIASGHRADMLIDAFSLLLAGGHGGPPLLETFAEMENDVHLAFAGSGLDEASLRARVAKLSIFNSQFSISPRVHFLGRFTPPEDIALAREADLLVDPVDSSPTNQAKSSHRVMLALATGTPLVAGDVGMRRFLLPSSLHADCLYDPSDTASLVAALRRGLAPEFAERFRWETAGLVAHWTSETLGKRFATLLEDQRR